MFNFVFMSEGATDNSQPLDDIMSTPPTTTYEPMAVNSARPANYHQLPTPTTPKSDYGEYVDINDSPSTEPAGLYEQLNNDDYEHAYNDVGITASP